MFVTAFCMFIDTNRGKFIYSNAGHPTPFLIQNGHSHIEELENQPGPALGMIPNTYYESHEKELGDRDMLFFFTDGLLELTNRDKVQFSTEELQRAIEHNMHLSPHSFVEAIMYAAEAFSEGLASSDDITLLAVSYQSQHASDDNIKKTDKWAGVAGD
jgi:serine phosphatase RsbU (regulator of sigma subunit)